MRITQTMISRKYSQNLNRALSDLDTASTRQTTLRNYDRTSDDPFSASKAYRLRRQIQANQDYQNNLGDVDSQLLTAQSSMLSINSIVQEANTGDCLGAISGSKEQSDRKIIADKLRKMQGAVLSALNTKFSDKYVFGGTNTDDPPFTLGTGGNLLYRGVDVNNGKIFAKDATGLNNALIKFNNDALNGYTVKVVDGGAGAANSVTASGTQLTVSMDLAGGKTNTDLLNALKSATGLTNGAGNALDLSRTTLSGGDPTLTLTNGVTSTDSIGQAGLKQLANEKAYVDIGLGLNVSGAIVDAQSVFNSALPGLSFVGLGTANGVGTGVSNNLYSLMGQIADQLESNSYTRESIQPYLDNFTSQSKVLLGAITKSGSDSTYLSTFKTRLENIGDSLVEKDDSVEFMDPAAAIMDFKMQQYAYRAALQMGDKVLGATFLDFMR